MVIYMIFDRFLPSFYFLLIFGISNLAKTMLWFVLSFFLGALRTAQIKFSDFFFQSLNFRKTNTFGKKIFRLKRLVHYGDVRPLQNLLTTSSLKISTSR